MGDFTYSVEVSNKFFFDIDEDDDPLEILKRQEARSKEEKAAKKNAEKAPKKETPTAKKPPAGKNEPSTLKKTPTLEAEPKKDQRPRRPPRAPNNADQDGNKISAAENRDPPLKRFDRADRGGDNREGREGRDSRDRDFRESGVAQRDNRDREGISSRYRGNRGGPRQDRGPREDRPPREDRGYSGAPKDVESGDGYVADEREGGYGRGRGSRSYVRGGRGRGIPTDRRPRRPFDRRSGSDRTGVKPVEKKDGDGAHNWGTVKDDVEGGEQPVNEADTSAEDTNRDWASQVEAENQSSLAGDSPEKSAQEKVKEMTLDEYRSIQTKTRAQAPTFNLRKANEGVDNAQWRKMVVLAGSKVRRESEEDVEDEEEEEPQPQNNLLNNIEFRFSDSPRRGGRGRRGGPERRGGPDRGGGRPDRFDRYDDRPGGSYRGARLVRGGDRGTRGSRVAAPNVMDERDFPSLVRAS